MTIFGIMALMVLAIVIGKTSKEFGVKQFLIIGLITLAQVFLAALEMFTKSVPPYR